MYSDYNDDMQDDNSSNQKNGFLNTVFQYLPEKKILAIIVILEVLVIIGLIFFKGKSVTIELENNPEYIAINDSKKINIKISGEIYTGNFNNINLKSDNPNLVSISNTGVLKANNYPGSTNITITYNENGKTYGGKGLINVYSGEKGVNLEEVNLPSLELRMKLSTTFELMDAIKFTPPNGYVESIEYVNHSQGIVKVDEKGSIEALSLGEGEVTVVVNNKLRRKFKVIVTNEDSNLGFGGDSQEAGENVDVDKISFNQPEIVISNNSATLTMKTNEIFNLIPEVSPTNATNKELTFEAQDKEILLVTTSADKTSATITALKKGTTTITVKSTNNVMGILTVIVSGTSNSSSSSSKRCYCNSANKCVWSSGKSGDYTNRQSQLPNSTACTIYSNNNGQACFKDSKGIYYWGGYGNMSGYSYVAGISSRSSCTSNSTVTDSITCTNPYKGESGQCVITTTTSSKIQSATSSDTSVIKITGNDTYKINYTCVDNKKAGNTSATITATLSSKKTVSKTVQCKNKNSISLVCNPTNPNKNETVSCKVNGLNDASELKKCSANNGNFSKNGMNCSGTYNGEGSVTITAETAYGNVSKTITFTEKNAKKMTVSCPSTAKVGSTVTCTVTGATNITCTADGGANYYFSGNTCKITYNGTDAKNIKVTFKANDAQTATRTISFTKDEVKTLNISGCPRQAITSFNCTPSGDAKVVSCSANNGATASFSGGKCTVKYEGKEQNHQVTVTFTSSDVVTTTGGKSKSITVTFNPQ